MAGQKIRIRLKSYDHEVIDNSARKIVDTVQRAGATVVGPVPLPTKIVQRVLDPIDIVAQFGEDPDVDEVDAHVRSVMQAALDELAAERRFPVIG